MTDLRPRSLFELQQLIEVFCTERDWDQFHSPKDLAIGVVTEAAELLDLFRFKSEDECRSLFSVPEKREDIEHEMADTLFFILRMAQLHGIDLVGALENKLALNAQKYPVDSARGSNKKYDEL